MINNIIKITGKPLEKLIQVIRTGLGQSIDSSQIAKDNEQKPNEQSDLTSNQNVKDIFNYQQEKKRKNLDYINFIAAEQISQEDSVSEESVEEDWTTRFFNIAEDISNEEMQQLWGRILAGEVKEPKSYSLRTLELLKNLSKREADVFSKVSNFVITSNNSPFLYRGKNSDILERYNITFEDKLLLIETGILQSESNITRTIKSNASDSITYFYYNRMIIKVLKKAGTPDNGIEIIRFTKIGEELLKLITPIASEDYIKDFCSHLEEVGLEVDYAFLLAKNPNGTVSHTIPWMKFDKK